MSDKAGRLIMGDLFCGRGGWTKGFQAHGWDCWGIDLNHQALYPGRFIQADIAQLIELPYADFYCCSSPCENFSVHGMRAFHKNPRWPWLGIALFEYAHYLLEQTGKPYIMENVRPAQMFVGKSVNHCGPFHLWGNHVPAIMPKQMYKQRKGSGGSWLHKTATAAVKEMNRNKRQRASETAEIPHEIANYIAQTANHAGPNL